LRVKRASAEMERVFDRMDEKAAQTMRDTGDPSPFLEITDEDIDALFSE
jgi:hypothetical protein